MCDPSEHTDTPTRLMTPKQRNDWLQSVRAAAVEEFRQLVEKVMLDPDGSENYFSVFYNPAVTPAHVVSQVAAELRANGWLTNTRTDKHGENWLVARYTSEYR